MPLPRLPALAALLLVALAQVAFVQVAFVQVAHAQSAPRSVGECERLKNDLAYNQCLSMFGPAAKNVAGGYAPGEAPTGPLAASATAAPNLPALGNAAAVAIPQVEEPVVQTRGGRRRAYRGRGGRQHAVFTAGSVEPRARRRRRH